MRNHCYQCRAATDLPETRAVSCRMLWNGIHVEFIGENVSWRCNNRCKDVRGFYFHLQTPEGLEPADFALWCEGPEDAFVEACRAIPGIAAEMLLEGRDPMECQFLIHHGEGN